jgi:hemolysin activation/secretion protein
MNMATTKRTAALAMLCGLGSASAAGAQTVLDRADPTAHSAEHVDDAAPLKQKPVPVAVETAAPAVAPQASIMIGAVCFNGLHGLDPAVFADIVADYVGRLAAPEDLASLAGRVAARAREKGFAFASAGIEPQRVTAGVLVVAVDEGRIDEVRLESGDNSAVRAALQPLVGAGPLTLAMVERRLLIAGDVDGVRIRSSRYVREQGRGILLVKVAIDRIAGRAAVRNDGSKPLGPEQVYLQVNANALLFADDSLTVSYQGTPAQPRELEYGRVRYAKRVSRNGTEVAISGSASASHPGAYYAPYDIVGTSWFGGISVLQPLQRRRTASWWLSGEFDVRGSTQSVEGERVRRDRLSIVRLALNGYREVIGGRLRVNASVSRGLGILGATRDGDPLASRRDADATFTSAELWADWTRTLGGGFSVRIAGDGQIADQPLLVSEEVGLGGGSFLRGYDWSERSGDQGIMGALELRYDWDKPLAFVHRAQFYGFVDGGTVGNLRGGYGGGTLSSAGAGVRADFTSRIGATAELAVPLTGARYDTGNSNPRVNLGVATSF